MPSPPQHAAQRRTGTVGDDQHATADVCPVGQRQRSHPGRRIVMNTNSFDAKSHPGAGFLGDFANPVVQLDAGHRATGRRERRAGPVDLDLAAESAHPQAAMPDPGIQPFAQPQPLQLGDRARRQPVAAGLIAGKVRRVDHQHVVTGPRGPGGRRRAGRSGAHHHHVGMGVHAHQYVGRVRTPATVVAGVDFGDAAFATDVRDGVARIEQLMETELRGSDDLMTDAVLHLFEAGGKRFRPLFTVLSAQLGPRPDSDEVTIAGAVIELVHLATLYHDDVMDEAQVRRGAPSANLRWGNNVAILAGDYLFATASRLVSRLGPNAVRIIAETFAQLVTGQMREGQGAANGADPIQHYLKVVHEKTACLIGAAGRFGAMFSGADEDQIQRLSRLGNIVGTAFQISDDIIDIDSDPDESGKLPGTDLREGVHTLPVLYALHDTGPDADRLRELLVGPIEDDDALAEALRLLRASPGMAKAQEKVGEFAAQAHEEMAALPESPGRNALATLVDYTIHRHG